jgi:cytidine deaminase
VSFHDRMLQLASRIAVLRKDKRAFRLGAVGIRKDGTIVSSCNSPNTAPDVHAHAEAKLVRKLDQGSTVYVVRVSRDGTWACAKPCYECLMLMNAKRVRQVFWSETEGYQCRILW